MRHWENTAKWENTTDYGSQNRTQLFSVCAKVLFLEWRALAVHFLISSSTDVFSLTCLRGRHTLQFFVARLRFFSVTLQLPLQLRGCVRIPGKPLLSHARFSRCCEHLRRHHNCKSSTCQLRQVISPTEPASPIRIKMAKWNVLLLVTPKRQGRDGERWRRGKKELRK